MSLSAAVRPDGTAGCGPCSLRWWLVSRLVTLQAAMLTAFGLMVFAALCGTGHLVNLEAEDHVLGIIAEAVERTPEGGLALRDTPALTRLRGEMSGAWFEVRDRAGSVLREGDVPPDFSEAGPALDRVGQARMGWNLGDPPRPSARLKRVETEAGPVQILAGTGGDMAPGRVLKAGLKVFAGVILPVFVVMAIATVIATPVVVRRALAGLGAAAREAERIRPDDREARLPTAEVPGEVLPLVQAVNDALDRLDQGYERRQRFLVDAAHELRTPIAILNTRLDALPDGPDKARLLADLARLSTLAEQLLDLQRIDQHLDRLAPLDLVALARGAVADLAPLAISAGFALSFEADAAAVPVLGEALSLERVLANLVQNAIEHAGPGGHILVRVEAGGVLEVMDDGPGIPEASRRQVFEPFQRLRPRHRGAGLGLHLVSEIVRMHKGAVAVLASPAGGARFRITLPPAPSRVMLPQSGAPR